MSPQHVMGRLDRLSRSPRAVLLSMMLSVICLILFVAALVYEVDSTQQEANHLRIAVCGVAERYLAAPGSPTTPKGNGLAEGLAQLRSRQGADCTPDLHDGK